MTRDRKEDGGKSTARLAAGLFAFTVLLSAGAVVLAWGTIDAVAVVIIGVWFTALAAVAALIAAKQNRNPVGWLLLGAALLLAIGSLVSAAAQYSVRGDPGSELAEWSGWLSLWVGTPSAGLLVIALLLFPNGRTLSSRWRVPIGVTIASSAGMTFGYAVKPGPIDNLPTIDNPLAFEGSGLLADLANGAFSMLVAAAGVLALVSLFIRMRRSEGLEQQQLKWFVYGVALFPVFFGAAVLADTILDAELGPGDHYVDFVLIMIGALLVPISMGVSMLRYRLYEIDLIINRTLVYAILTAILASVYLGIVVLLQQLVATVATDSDIAVAGSTLIVAALFRPLRSQVQGFIDRRFYRRKYDASATLEQFAGRLREEIDLGSLSHELVAVVSTTMQPAHASLWLRTGVE